MESNHICYSVELDAINASWHCDAFFVYFSNLFLPDELDSVVLRAVKGSKISGASCKAIVTIEIA